MPNTIRKVSYAYVAAASKPGEASTKRLITVSTKRG
jgi:hypothetical protein